MARRRSARPRGKAKPNPEAEKAYGELKETVEAIERNERYRDRDRPYGMKSRAERRFERFAGHDD